jgi:hypothetical protein
MDAIDPNLTSLLGEFFEQVHRSFFQLKDFLHLQSAKSNGQVKMIHKLSGNAMKEKLLGKCFATLIGSLAERMISGTKRSGINAELASCANQLSL